MSISERIRPGIEAAPWVCVEVGKLEASYAASTVKISDMTARIAELEDALKLLMEWQVKNVKKWHNRPYDNASEVLEKADLRPNA